MLKELEEKIGYRFHNPKYLATALTHSSYANEKIRELERVTSGWNFRGFGIGGCGGRLSV